MIENNSVQFAQPTVHSGDPDLCVTDGVEVYPRFNAGWLSLQELSMHVLNDKSQIK